MNGTTLRSRIVRIVSVCAAVLAVQACRPNPPEPPPPSKPAYTKEFLKSVLQNLTLDRLGPAGTAVEILAESPAGTRVFLKAWADTQLREANDMVERTPYPGKAEWEAKRDWYEAVSGCMGRRECDDLRRLQEAKDRAKIKSSRPLPPPPQFRSEGGTDAGDAGGHP
ncbi:MAG: hypothetical protein KUA43_15705 [Hoeflea sp.]|uniref:hypothetical protein n=1 Tax=Hoeflea sp. TaxID=1940281 RepID=UPI001D34E24B|nr:hypothetical protein [Hoeflea sp.]MBU4531606.1 hypothetical protein [Alphaproteobacteria bacterium]MBU4544463.1 hypothetical protein [Alphaproteobacteria bacterium]MBU4552694.1 hypothetical protein [Alphaproteobacteria bacterium]MBV1724882.1 hypothetical protein [Hoeflea sp.]MBV1760902.1 hypothetical protein [Hoeflea sp.]